MAERRTTLTTDLRALGVEVPDSHANFVWMPLAGRTRGFVRACAAAGVLVKEYADRGVRVSVGTADEIHLLVTVARTFLT